MILHNFTPALSKPALKWVLIILFLILVCHVLVSAQYQYRYDSLNRLVAVYHPNGDRITYLYDAVGNRLSTSIEHPSYRSWIGVIDDSWDKPGNWSPYGLPQAGDDVFIPESAPFMPVVKIQGFSCRDVVVFSGGSLSIRNGIVLTVNGTMVIH